MGHGDGFGVLPSEEPWGYWGHLRQGRVQLRGPWEVRLPG